MIDDGFRMRAELRCYGLESAGISFGCELALPMDEDDLAEKVAEFRNAADRFAGYAVSEETFIADLSTSDPGIGRIEQLVAGHAVPLYGPEDANLLAMRLAMMSEDERRVANAAVECMSPVNAGELLNLCAGIYDLPARRVCRGGYLARTDQEEKVGMRVAQDMYPELWHMLEETPGMEIAGAAFDFAEFGRQWLVASGSDLVDGIVIGPMADSEAVLRSETLEEARSDVREDWRREKARAAENARGHAARTRTAGLVRSAERRSAGYGGGERPAR